MIVVRTPLRVSFGGGGTDLAAYYDRFGGFVLSSAITRYCYVMAGPAADGGIHINSADYRAWADYARGETPSVEEPLALPKAAVCWFGARGVYEYGIDLFLASQVPPGTGLGSSSAMAASLGRAIAAYLDQPPTHGERLGSSEPQLEDRPGAGAMDAQAVAELACWLEIERLGMPIGRQDQYACAFGGLNIIEFADDAVHVAPLPLPPDVIASLQRRLLLFSTGRAHNSAQILRRQRSDSRANPRVIESLHHIKRLAWQMCEALTAQDLDRFGDLLDQSWQMKKRLSERISSGAIDNYYAAARAAGALGGKITGAGGGGFLLLYCPVPRQPAVRAALARHGLTELAFDFDFSGTTVLTEWPREICSLTAPGRRDAWQMGNGDGHGAIRTHDTAVPASVTERNHHATHYS